MPTLATYTIPARVRRAALGLIDRAVHSAQGDATLAARTGNEWLASDPDDAGTLRVTVEYLEARPVRAGADIPSVEAMAGVPELPASPSTHSGAA